MKASFCTWHWPRRLLLTLMLGLAALTALAGCAPPGSDRAPRPQPTKVPAHAGATSLCAAVSPADFARVTGQSATEVTPGTTVDGLTSLPEVYCIYADAADPQQLVGRGTINFEIA